MIHKTAIIDSKAIVAESAEVGPYCVIGPNVVIGENVKILSHVNISGNTVIGKQNKIYPCKNCEDTKIKREKCILIRSTFSETNNISAVSRKLGVSRTTIYKHLQ